jgi:hypothetical protein
VAVDNTTKEMDITNEGRNSAKKEQDEKQELEK